MAVIQDDYTIFVLTLFSGFFAFILLRLGFRARPEIEFDSFNLIIRGVKVPIDVIDDFNVCRVRSRDIGVLKTPRILQIKTRNNDSISNVTKLNSLLNKINLHEESIAGFSLFSDPKILINLNETDLSDDQLNMSWMHLRKEGEQVVGGDGAEDL